jgi:putative aldouronate transport system permease protein
MVNSSVVATKKKKRKKITGNDIQLIVLASLSIIFIVIFVTIPTVGLILAFKNADYKSDITRVIFEGDFNNFQNFRNIFNDSNFFNVLFNTIGLNSLCLILTFPAPILFALLLNEIPNKKIRTVIQTICILPNFLSWVVYGGICLGMMDMSTGIFNPILTFLGLSTPEHPIDLNSADYFWAVIIVTALIKGAGWGSVIYTASIAGIDPTLYEAAEMDGAGKLRKAFNITLPSLAPTITIFLLLQISRILGNSYEHFYVFQNVLNLDKSEVLTTYIFKIGIINGRYGFTTALGLLESTIALLLVTFGNKISKRLTGRGLYQ